MKHQITGLARTASFLMALLFLPAGVQAQTFITIPLQQYTLGSAKAAAFSPDGKSFATAGTGGVFLWETGNANAWRRIGETTNIASQIAFSPDRKYLLTGSRLWDLATGNLLHAFGENPRLAAFSPDGKYVLTATSDTQGRGTARLWSIASGTQVKTFIGPLHESFYCLAFSPDGKRFVTGSGQFSNTLCTSTMRLWDVSSGATIRLYQFLYHRGASAEAVAFSPDGKRIFSCHDNKTVRLWDAATTKCLGIYEPFANVVPRFAAYSADGSRILLGGYNQAQIRDSEMKNILGQYEGTPIAFSSDGLKVLTDRTSYNDANNTVCQWNASTQALEKTYGRYINTLGGQGDGICQLSVSRDASRMLASMVQGNYLELWDSVTGARLLKYKTLDDAWLMPAAFSLNTAVSPDGKQIFTTDSKFGARLWSTNSSSAPLKSYPHIAIGTKLLFSPDGKGLLAADKSDMLCLWDINSTSASKTYQGAGKNSFCFAGDGKRFVTDGGDKVLLWDTDNSALLGAYSSNGLSIEFVAISDDGGRIAGAGSRLVGSTWQGEVCIWDTASSAPIQTIIVPNVMIHCMALSPDGSRVLTGDRGIFSGQPGNWGNARLWSADTGKILRTFAGHNGSAYVSGAAFSPDGTKAFTAGTDGVLYQWDATVNSTAKNWNSY